MGGRNSLPERKDVEKENIESKAFRYGDYFQVVLKGLILDGCSSKHALYIY